MQWKFSGDTPIYTQLIRQIKMGIVSGGFSPGERLPTVRELAAEAGVNPNTMQRSLAELEREGLVYSQRTAGRFVTEESQIIDAVREELARQYIRAFLESMNGLGYNEKQVMALLRQGSDKEEEANGNSGM